MLNILVVCTANICRSPAAAAFLNRALTSERFNVDSAGTMAIDGNRADLIVQDMMAERGYPDLAQHRSSRLMLFHLKKYQLILCMENSHLINLHSTSPVSVGRSMLLGHWHGGREVQDPTGKSRDVYKDSLDEIQLLSSQWANKIIAMGLTA